MIPVIKFGVESIFVTKTFRLYYGENVYYGKEVKKVGHHEILFGLHCAQNDPKG